MQYWVQNPITCIVHGMGLYKLKYMGQPVTNRISVEDIGNYNQDHCKRTEWIISSYWSHPRTSGTYFLTGFYVVVYNKSMNIYIYNRKGDKQHFMRRFRRINDKQLHKWGWFSRRGWSWQRCKNAGFLFNDSCQEGLHITDAAAKIFKCIYINKINNGPPESVFRTG